MKKKMMNFGRIINSSVQFSCSAGSDSLQPHGLQHTGPPCPSPTPGVYSNSCPLSWWCIQPSHPLSSPSPLPSILLSIRVFSNESTLRIRWPKYWVSASKSVLPMNTQDWSPLGWRKHKRGGKRIWYRTISLQFCIQYVQGAFRTFRGEI